MAEVFIETPRLLLRQWVEADYEAYIRINMDKEIMEFFPSTLTRDETIAQIERISNFITANGYGLFAMERKDNGRFIGFTGLNSPGFKSYFTPCTEVGWRLGKADWNHGFATEAAKACINFGFEQLKLNQIYSFTSVYNARSERVMVKAGMEKTGTFDHPFIEVGCLLKEHVLYKIASPAKD